MKEKSKTIRTAIELLNGLFIKQYCFFCKFDFDIDMFVKVIAFIECFFFFFKGEDRRKGNKKRKGKQASKSKESRTKIMHVLKCLTHNQEKLNVRAMI